MFRQGPDFHFEKAVIRDKRVQDSESQLYIQYSCYAVISHKKENFPVNIIIDVCKKKKTTFCNSAAWFKKAIYLKTENKQTKFSYIFINIHIAHLCISTSLFIRFASIERNISCTLYTVCINLYIT